MSPLQILLLILLFLSVSFAVLAVVLAFARGSTLRGRLRSLIEGQGSSRSEQASVEEGGWSQSVVRAVVDPMSRLATPDKEDEVSKFRERFVRAGIRDPNAPFLFFGAKAALALLVPLIVLLMLQIFLPNLPGFTTLSLAFVVASMGYYAPNYVLEILVKRRQQEIIEAFPDALDLMVVCVEAGLGLDLAINRVAEEMAIRSTVLSDELRLVGLDLRVGSSRERALTNFAARIDLEEVHTFVTMLLQAERFGTSLGESLRIHADMLRTKRQLRAEEAAAKIGLKMLFPLIFFIFPTLMLVLMGPAMIQVYRLMSQPGPGG